MTILENARDTFNNMKIYIKEIYDTQTKDLKWLQEHKNLELLYNKLPDKNTWLYTFFGIYKFYFFIVK